LKYVFAKTYHNKVTFDRTITKIKLQLFASRITIIIVMFVYWIGWQNAAWT